MSYDPSLSHFDLDRKRGAQGEIFVQDICGALGDGTGTIEVKSDHKFVETNRFYIERECKGRDGIWRPSGINVTRATFWALVLGGYNAVLIVATEWLRAAVADAAKDDRNHMSCDYGQNPTRGVTIYINHLLKTKDAGAAA